MEKFMTFSVKDGREITVRTSAIIAITTIIGENDKQLYTELTIHGFSKPVIVEGEYIDVKNWVEAAED